MNCFDKVDYCPWFYSPVSVRRSQGFCGVDGVQRGLERGLASVILHRGAGHTVLYNSLKIMVITGVEMQVGKSHGSHIQQEERRL